MRWPRARLKLQWLMVWIVIAAILTDAVIEVGPDLKRRWVACREKADFYAAEARWCTTQKVPPGWPAESRRRWPDLIRRERESYLQKSAKYRRALYVPWEFYSLGSGLPPG